MSGQLKEKFSTRSWTVCHQRVGIDPEKENKNYVKEVVRHRWKRSAELFISPLYAVAPLPLWWEGTKEARVPAMLAPSQWTVKAIVNSSPFLETVGV